MKKIFFLFFAFPFISVKSQTDSSNFEKLLTNCKNDYLTTVNTYSKDFYTGLRYTTRHNLDPYNSLFFSVADELSIVWPTEDKESVFFKIADSVYSRIRNKYLWQGREADSVKFTPIFELFNNKYCPCASSRQIPPESLGMFSILNNECEAALRRDFLFMNAIQTQIKKLPFDEQTRVQSLRYWYEFQNCPAFTNHIHSVLLDELKGNFDYFYFSLNYNLPEKFLDIYLRKNNDSLKQIFPSFSKFIIDIDAASKLNVQKVMTMKRTDRNTKEKTTTMQITYYKKNKTTTVLGQVICKTDNKNGFKPVIQSFSFIPVSKISNLKALLKEIEKERGMPPPPMEEIIKDVRIDTIPQKN